MDIQYLGDHREVLPVLAAWIYGEWSYLYPEMTIPDLISMLRERINKKKLPLTLVAIHAGEPVGTVSLRTFEMETRRDMKYWLTSLYVVKPWRRRKIGTRLVTTAEQKACELDICSMFLYTTDFILPAQFYSKLGWMVKEQTVYHSHPVIIMEKDLCST